MSAKANVYALADRLGAAIADNGWRAGGFDVEAEARRGQTWAADDSVHVLVGRGDSYAAAWSDLHERMAMGTLACPALGEGECDDHGLPGRPAGIPPRNVTGGRDGRSF